MNIDGFVSDETQENLSLTDKWILTKYSETVKSVTKYMDKFELNNAGAEIYNFIYDDFCDNYIEFAKFNMECDTTKKVLVKVLKGILKMLHPFMPYVTDEIYRLIPGVTRNIMISDYPKYNKKEIFKEDAIKVGQMIEFIKIYRKTYQENHMNKSIQIKFNNYNDYDLIKRILKIENITDEALDITAYPVHFGEYDVTIYFESLVTEEDKALLQKEIESLKASIVKRKGLLANQNFVNRAPSNLVEQEREKLKQEEEKLHKLES